MTALRVQGMAFVALSSFLIVFSSALARLDQQAELIVLTVLIILLGVPHGALDTVFAQQQYRVQGVLGWLVFALAYCLPVLFVLWLWKLTPLVFLLMFFVISIFHFSGDPATGTPPLSRLFYGGAIVILPSLLHAAEIERTLSFLIGVDQASRVVPLLHWIAWPWLLGLAASGLFALRSNWLTGLELIAMGFLCVLAPPLLAFTAYFCAMHSARHILRSLQYAESSTLRPVIQAALLPMLGVVILLAAGFVWLRDLSLEAQLIQLVFVTLAALTLPHMALVEQVRFLGWERKLNEQP